MKVPHSVVGRVRDPDTSHTYLRDSGSSDLAKIGRGIGAALGGLGAAWDERQEKAQKFGAFRSFSEFETQAAQALEEAKRDSAASDANFLDRATASYDDSERKFISTLPAQLQDEFRARAGEFRQRVIGNALKFQYESQDAFFKQGVKDEYEKAKTSLDPSLGGDPSQLAAQKARLAEVIAATDLPDAAKSDLARLIGIGLEGVTYKATVKSRIKEAGGGNVNLPGEIAAVIDAAAQAEGVDPLALRTIAWLESKGDPSAQNPKSSAGGLFQFINSTAQQYGLTNKFDAKDSARAGAELARDNSKGLKKVLGRDPSVGELYLAHQQGLGGAQKLLSNPDALAVDVVGYDAVRLNGGAPGMTAQEFANLWINKANAAAGTVQIDDDPAFAGLPYEDRLALRADAEREAQSELNDEAAARKAAYNQNFNSLMLGIHDGQAGQMAIDEARSSWLTDYDDIKKAEDALATRDKEGALTSAGLMKLSSDTSIWDPTSDDDKKMQNAVFRMAGPQALTNLDQSYITSGLAPMAQRTGDLPTEAVGLLWGMTRSLDSKRMLFAYNALSLLKQAAPDAFNARVNDTLAASVQFFEDRKNMVDAETLAAQLNPGTNQENRQGVMVLRTEANEYLNHKEDGIPKIKDLVNEVVGSFDQNWTNDPVNNALPWAGLGLERDFRVAFTDEYVRRGNVEEATQAGIKALKRTWAVTDIGGKQTLMRLPPEKAGYKKLNGSFDWIERQVRGELAIPEGDRFQLLSDDQTRQEWQKSQLGGEPPSYQVIRFDAEGTPFLVMEKGSPARIWFKPPEIELRKEETQFEVDRATKVLGDAVVKRERARQTYSDMGEGLPPEFDDEVNAAQERVDELTARRKALDPQQSSNLLEDTLLPEGQTKIAPEIQEAMQPTSKKENELSGVERTFLNALSGAESAGLGGTAVRLYNDIIQRGRTAPITEADFSVEEQTALRDVVLRDANGKMKGKIDYKDYRTGEFDHNILGGFSYEIKNGEIIIDDVYDFNADRADGTEDNVFVQALATVANPRGLAASIGRKKLSDLSGKSVPVKIRLSVN